MAARVEGNVGVYDTQTGQWRPASPAEQAAALAERAHRNASTRNQFIKQAIVGTAATLAGGYGAAALAGSGGAGLGVQTGVAGAGFGGAPITTGAAAGLGGTGSGIGLGSLATKGMLASSAASYIANRLRGPDTGPVSDTSTSGIPSTFNAPRRTASLSIMPYDDPSQTSANAPRMIQRNGQWILQEHGNERPLVGDEVQHAQNYTNEFWSKFPTGFQPDNPNSVDDASQQFLGHRTGIPYTNPQRGSFLDTINGMANSDEASQYRSRTQAAVLGGATKQPNMAQSTMSGVPYDQYFQVLPRPPLDENSGPWTPKPWSETFPMPDGGVMTPGGVQYPKTSQMTPLPGVPANMPDKPFTGVKPKQMFEGFNLEREQDIHKSAKDAFAYLADQAPPRPEDKGALATWFHTYIEPGMNALGHKVVDVNDDTFRFQNQQGDFTVDYVRGAGAPGSAFAWQVQDVADGGPAAQSYNQTTQRILGQNPGVSNTMPIGNFASPLSPISGGQSAAPTDELAQYYYYLQQLLQQGQVQR